MNQQYEQPQSGIITRRQWIVVLGLMTGAITTWVDSSAVPIILPKIMSGFGLNVIQGSWVANATYLAVAMVIPASGWMGNTFGRSNVYIWSIGLFVFAIVGCGFAWNPGSLIFFRVLAGIASGLAMPTSVAIIFETFPEDKRGLAIGVYSFGASTGIAWTTVFLGRFAEVFAWRAFFYFNIPLALLSFISAILLLPKHKRQQVVQLDLWGAAFMAIFLLSLLLALTQGRRYGWGSDYILALFAVFAVSLILFITVELKRRNPFVELRLYRNYVYFLSAIVATSYGVILIGTSFLVPLFVQTVMGYDVFKTSLLTLPSMMVGSFVLLLAGWMADKVPARFLLVAGLGFYIFSMYSMSMLNQQSSFDYMVFIMILREVGGGLLFAPLVRASLNSLPRSQIGMGSGLINLNRQIGGMVGIAFFGTFLESRQVFYKQMLGQSQSDSPFATRYFLNGMKSLFVSQGNTEGLASAKAITILDQVVGGQALVNSFNDCFILMAIMVVLVIIPAMLIK